MYVQALESSETVSVIFMRKEHIYMYMYILIILIIINCVFLNDTSKVDQS